MKFLNTKEVAALLRTSPVIIRQSRASGILWGRPAPKHIKIGQRKVLYSEEEIERWIHEINPQRAIRG